ncbi:ENTH-domain-containing protein [Violaceomyces palustris]|uniref:ENTH-domain-containing protein n=1 Tax=Violaceomyces palustris TaxID=1673888 RepID=A0ACD0P3Z1_9BASI|nr:ENTH-domain-containing protein [Violaceomyces palustris]
MDFEDIGSKLSNLTFYDVKSLYTQAVNYALNVSEIEAKVKEATNDDPWGASSTLMQEIAAATHNFQDFNEIMPAIYRRFMEKEAREWRQIYKSLQLLEYLVKNGSERVVDDARSHLATIKILRNFHYIDEKGKDQGLNVRNRAKELAELLSDVDRIRQERKRAKQNRNKYTGGGSGEFVPGSGTGRYGGFGSDSYYAGQAGGGGGYGGGSSTGGGAARQSFEEYDAGEYEESTSNAPRPGSSSTTRGASGSGRTTEVKRAEPKAAPVVADLFSFDDDEPDPPSSSSNLAAGAAVTAASSNAGPVDAFADDFDDFQGAAPAAPPKPSAPIKPSVPAPAPKQAASSSFDFFGSEPAPKQAAPPSSSSTARVHQPPGYASSSPLSPSSGAAATQRAPPPPATSSAATSNTSGGLNFDDLWAVSSGKAGSGGNAGKGKMTMAEMAKSKSSSAVWGAPGSSSSAASAGGQKKDIFDLL